MNLPMKKSFKFNCLCGIRAELAASKALHMSYTKWVFQYGDLIGTLKE